MKIASASPLALDGGPPVRQRPFPAYNTIGEEEKRAVREVLDSGVLSAFLGTDSPQFYGGPRVQKLEREWERYFGVKHAVSMNSATSGLNAAIGAAGIKSGDEVIVSPYSMSASASCVLAYGGTPVFADVDADTFCISAETIAPHITTRTRAVVVVDLFGHPADFDPIMALARAHGVIVIEDAAQAPGARYRGGYAGTLADIGVFSLNCHKTIQSGEGGVVVTNNDDFCERLQLIRNHGEAVVGAEQARRHGALIGFNYRMTEIEAAIASEQLKKLERLLQPRIAAAQYFDRRLSAIPGITPPMVKPDVRHGYYVYAMKYDATWWGVSRSEFARALGAEGIPISEGYVAPIYRQPIYQSRPDAARFRDGICPVAERLYERELLLTNLCYAGLAEQDLDDVASAFEKLAEHREQLRTHHPVTRMTAAGMQ